MRPTSDSASVHTSPSGKYTLEIVEYTEGPQSWNYSRGTVRQNDSGELIADVKRNLGNFWFCWVLRSDGEYLLCGEDYQGYNIIDLAGKQTVLTFPPEAYEGGGFCWVSVHPSPSGSLLAVEGCYWGGSNELVIYDFSNPTRSPLRELFRVDYLADAGSWQSDFEFTYSEGEDEPYQQRSWVKENQ